MSNPLSPDAPEIIPPVLRWSWLHTLTVVTALAVFALYFLPSQTGLIIPARVSQTRAAMKGLWIAMKGFDAEYGEIGENKFGKLMQLSETEDTIVGDAILRVLMKQSPELNPRRIHFYDPPLAKKKLNGLWKDPSGKMHLSDAWGDPFKIRYDADGDGKIRDPEGTGEILGSTYIFYTAGPDGDFSTWKDNLASWKWTSAPD